MKGAAFRRALLSASALARELSRRVDARERGRHHRVSERADANRAGVDLALAPRDEEVSRRGSEGDDALSRRSLRPRPDEQPRRAKVEAAQRAELHLDGSLDPTAEDRPAFPVRPLRPRLAAPNLAHLAGF